MPHDESADGLEQLSDEIVLRARYEAAQAIIRYHEDPKGFYQEAQAFVAEIEQGR